MPLDPNNQNYFSLEEQAVTAVPWWKMRKFHVQLVVVFAVILGVGIVGYYGYQAYSLTHVNVEALNQAQVILDNAASVCATETDPSLCEARARADAARSTGETSVCKGLGNEEMKNCVSLIANDQANPSLCSMLSGDDETTCKDGATLVLAQEQGNYALCTDINDASLQTACKDILVNVVIANGECEKYEIRSEICDYPAALALVVDGGDPTACAQFSGEQESGCEDMFTSIDADGDGLSLFEEFKLGTSDNTADTDQDGYTDSEEVSSGHDPLR